MHTVVWWKIRIKNYETVSQRVGDTVNEYPDYKAGVEQLHYLRRLAALQQSEESILQVSLSN